MLAKFQFQSCIFFCAEIILILSKKGLEVPSACCLSLLHLFIILQDHLIFRYRHSQTLHEAILLIFKLQNANLYHYLGLKWDGLLPAMILPIILTAVLFAGPLTILFLDQDQSWKTLFSNTRLVYLHFKTFNCFSRQVLNN